MIDYNDRHGIAMHAVEAVVVARENTTSPEVRQRRGEDLINGVERYDSQVIYMFMTGIRVPEIRKQCLFRKVHLHDFFESRRDSTQNLNSLML
jgi:hypothetical protein